MDPIALASIAAVLWMVLIPFTSYCIVDSNKPTQPTSWFAFLTMQCLLVGAGVGAYYLHSSGSRFTFVTTMLFLGMMFAAAAVDPTQVIREPNESTLSYLKRFTFERVRRVAISKVVVYVAALIATYTFPRYWYLALLLVVLHLHYYKMASCIAAESGEARPQDAPTHVQRKWQWRAVSAAIVLGLLLKGPQTVFEELDYVPDAWGAFGGFTLMSAALFLVGMLTNSDA